MNSLNDLELHVIVEVVVRFIKKKHLTKCFPKQKPSLKVAKELGETSLMFLVHPTIHEDDIYKICDKTEKIIKQCLR